MRANATLVRTSDDQKKKSDRRDRAWQDRRYRLLPDDVDWSKVDVPIQAHVAKHDDWATVASAQKVKAAIPVPMDLHVYDAKHAFANERRPDVYNPEAAKQAWGPHPHQPSIGATVAYYGVPGDLDGSKVDVSVAGWAFSCHDVPTRAARRRHRDDVLRLICYAFRAPK